MDIFIKDIKGYEGYYQVDSNGVVYGVERYVKKWDGIRKIEKSILKEGTTNCGYVRVNLCKNGKNKKHSVHRLVATAFIPNPENKPCVNHIDGNKKNNKLENLEWVTHKENTNHAVKTLKRKFGGGKKGQVWYKTQNKPTPSKKIILMFDKNENLIKEFDSLTSAGVFLGKHAAQIQQYASGRRNHKKYIFKYKNNNLC